MKNVTLLVLTSTLAIASANAGEKAGNGGVMFECHDRLKLVDVWEAEDRGYPMSIGDRNDTLSNLITEYDRRIRFFDPELADEYLAKVKIIFLMI